MLGFANGTVFRDVTPWRLSIVELGLELGEHHFVALQTTRVSHHHPPNFPNFPSGDDLWVE